ncbi:MAG: class I SAM-dependent methyltransferase, partial [Thermoguttaceae bacterium]|nr:class I SAM-dependent methyltransferase [Thermoguttaceae bacterium]
MFLPSEYCLLDFGAGRKLEQFGSVILDRPCPVATLQKSNPAAWSRADAVFEEDLKLKQTALGHRGIWLARTATGREYFCDSAESPARASWSVRHENPSFKLLLKGSPFGHLGIFPEQSRNWDDLSQWCQRFASQTGRPAQILNLFAYTGGSTLAAAAPGAHVFHVDAARNIDQQARENATESFGQSRTIHWITEDAVKYVSRCVKRGTKFDAIVLDPPNYGHGAQGEVWRFSKNMPALLTACFATLEKESSLILLSCHVPQCTSQDLTNMLEKACRASNNMSKSVRFLSRANCPIV